MKLIVSVDGKQRIKLFERPDGTFGYDEFYFDEEERAWCMRRSRQNSYPVFDTLEHALQEVMGRVPWARQAIEPRDE